MRFLDVEKFKSQCELLPVFEKIQLMRSVTNLKGYPPIAIKEFYANLMPTIKLAGSTKYGCVWLRGKSYNFTPTTINMYLRIDADDIEDPVMGANTITKFITGVTTIGPLKPTCCLPSHLLPSTQFCIRLQ